MNENNTSKIELISLISNFLSLVSSILTILSFVIACQSPDKIIELVLFVVGIILLLFTILFVFRGKKVAKRIMVFVLNKTIPNNNIIILDKKVIYEHVERHEYKFRSSFKIKVIGDEPVKEKEECIKWSARYIDDIYPCEGNHKIERIENNFICNGMDRQFFKIVFPHSLSKNDEPYKTGFKVLNLIDDKHIAKPMLVVSIYDITKNLTLKVYFKSDLNPIRPRGLKYAHFIDKIPYDTIPLEKKYDDEKEMHYVEFFVKNPIYGGKYAIDWSFND